MNPPTEQLARDYLNRLSVAAKSKLGFRERQALLDQTRARIELECGGVACATAVQVRQVLATLGDPIALVEAEYARITAARQAAGRIPRPRPAASFPDAPVPGGGPLPGGDPGGESLPGGETVSSAGPQPSAEPETPVGPEWPTQPELVTQDPDVSQAGLDVIQGPAARSAKSGPPGAGAAAGRFWQLGASMLTLARRHKLEAVAIVLLGLGGAIFPPIWIIGAGIVSISKIWDIRDKWLGIVVPILAVIVGTVLVVVFGGVHSSLGSYASEAWLSAGRLCRLAALAGAGYLLWRLRRGRRRPKQPPWKVPHKFG